MATESAPVDISPEGPKTRSKLKRAKGSDSPSRDSSSCPSIKNKKKKFKKPKKNPGDGSSDDNSESSEDDYQYVIDGPNIDKRIKIKYMEEVGVEDEIRDLKDAAFKKDTPNNVRPNQFKGKGHRSRNMNCCATCDEPGEDLIICARCPNSFHPSCMTVPTTSRKSSSEPWICLRCTYENNDLNLPRRLPKVLPFSEESRFNSVLDETLKKEAAEGNVSFERALEVYGNLSNPRTFSLPRELLDELVDMPFMEHIPRKVLCQSDAVCFVCKENHTEKNPCIQCDYCPAAFHLHCQNIPMTAILNEFWMCPLHAEIAIDRFALTSVSISSRMFLWNRSRTAIKGKKTFKSFIQKTKQLQRSQTRRYSFEDVPTYVDSLMLKKDFEVEVPNQRGRSRASRSFSLPKPVTRSSSRFSKASSVNSEDGNILNTLFDEVTDEKEDQTRAEDRVIPHRPYPEAYLPTNSEDRIEALLHAAEYLDQYNTELSGLKNYHKPQKYDIDRAFSEKTEELTETVEPRHFPLHSAPFEHYDSEKMLEDRGYYSLQDLRPAATYVSSSGGERSTAGMAYASVTDLYYDDSYEDYRERAIHRLTTFHESLLREGDYTSETNIKLPETSAQTSSSIGSDQIQVQEQSANVPNDISNEKSMDVDMSSTTPTVNIKNEPSSTFVNSPLNIFSDPVVPALPPNRSETLQDPYKLIVHKFGNLFDGQLGYPVKAYYFVRYYAIFHTDGEKIFIRYSRVDPNNQLSLPNGVPEQILDFAPESFTEILEIEEVQDQSNLFRNSKTEESKIFATVRDSKIWSQCFDYLRNSKKIKNKKETAFEILKAAGFLFKKTKKNKISIIPPAGDKETIFNKILTFSAKICNGQRIKDEGNIIFGSQIKQEMIEKNELSSPARSSANPKAFQEDALTIGGLEKEFEESDESVPASVKESDKQTASERVESEDLQEEETTSAGSRELRRWSSITSNDDVNLDDINLEDLDLDTLIPEKPDEPELVVKDKKDYLVETPDFRRYLRKANAEIAGIRKLVNQLKKAIGQDVDEAPVVRKTHKRKKGALKKQESSLEECSSKELLKQVLEGRKRFNELIEDHRGEGTKKGQPEKETSSTSTTSSETLGGKRSCKTKMTSLNEKAIVKAAFNASSSGGTQSSQKSGSSASTNKRRADDSESLVSEPQDGPKPSKRQLKNLEGSGADELSAESTAVDTNSEDALFTRPELPKRSRALSPTLTGKVDLFKVPFSEEDAENPLKFTVKAVGEDGQEKWYNVTLPDDFYEKKSKKKAKKEKVKILKEKKKTILKTKEKKKSEEKKIVKKSETKKPKKVKKIEKVEKQTSPVVIPSVKEEKPPTVKAEKKKKPKRRRNPPPDPTKRSLFIKKLIKSMLPSKHLIDEEFDTSKLIPLQCRKIGDFFYLMYRKKDVWIVVSRFPFVPEVLASNVPLEVRELISLGELKEDLPGEVEGISYSNAIDTVIEYERAHSALDKGWKMNSGVINLKKIKVNENAEYNLDQRFLKPDLPIIGVLIMMSPVHSYSTIPIHFPSTSFGFLPSSTVDISLLSPKCKNLGPDHAYIFYDKLTATVYLRANCETMVDGEIYGDTLSPSENLKCQCNQVFKDIKSPVDRLPRAPLRDNSVIQMGCLKFVVTLMNAEQIWSEIPGTCPALSRSDGGIGVEDNINDLPDMSDSDLTDFSSS